MDVGPGCYRFCLHYLYVQELANNINLELQLDRVGKFLRLNSGSQGNYMGKRPRGISYPRASGYVSIRVQ